jgi:hypothetical protein
MRGCFVYDPSGKLSSALSRRQWVEVQRLSNIRYMYDADVQVSIVLNLWQSYDFFESGYLTFETSAGQLAGDLTHKCCERRLGIGAWCLVLGVFYLADDFDSTFQP